MDEFKKIIKEMKPRQQAYEIVKAEMIARGRWKAKSRGWQVAGGKRYPFKGKTE